MSYAMQAMIPKARGMYAKALSNADYLEMMRRRSVPELAAFLRRHPYFEKSLSALASNPHRGQLEELLDKDTFGKYEQLRHYYFEKDDFSYFYADERELEILLQKAYQLNVGITGKSTTLCPAHLLGKTYTDLFALSTTKSLQDMKRVLKKGHSPYVRIFSDHLEEDPQLKNFPGLEAQMWREYYRRLFLRIDESFEGRERENVRRLFLQQVENFNIRVIYRIKCSFNDVFDEAGIRSKLLPMKTRLTRSQLDALVRAKNRDEFLQVYRKIPFIPKDVPEEPEQFSIMGDRELLLLAQQILHMSTSPAAVMAAFTELARLQKENVVNIIEGVRYGMKPEQMELLLCR